MLKELILEMLSELLTTLKIVMMLIKCCYSIVLRLSTVQFGDTFKEKYLSKIFNLKMAYKPARLDLKKELH